MKYSFIVPVYNGEKYIDRCINNLLMQSYTNFEIIIVNDGSEDESEPILKKYAEKYKEKVVLINQKNNGLSISRNIGLENSRGDYILFVDIDDIFHLDGLKIIDDNLDNDYDLVKFNWTGNKKLLGNNFDRIVKTGPEALKSLIKKKEVFEMAPIYAYKKKFLDTINFKFKPYRYHEDFGLIPLTILKARLVMILNSNLYYYDQTNVDSITRSGDYNKTKKKAYDVLKYCVEINNDIDNLSNVDYDVIKLFKSYNVNAVLAKSKTLKNKERKEFNEKIVRFKILENLHTNTILQSIKKFYIKIKYAILIKKKRINK